MASDALIDKYIDPATPPGGARLREYGVSVWALVGYLRVVEGDPDRVAKDYDISREALDAALSYYKEHQWEIDARLMMNAA